MANDNLQASGPAEAYAIPEMRRIKRIHFIGIGGVGMCGIAEVLLNHKDHGQVTFTLARNPITHVHVVNLT